MIDGEGLLCFIHIGGGGSIGKLNTGSHNLQFANGSGIKGTKQGGVQNDLGKLFTNI